jgi:Coenzyme PQQ synthesis protein D (PqqD)
MEMSRSPESMPGDTRVRRSDRAIFREVDDGTGLVLHLDTADYFGLNAVGRLVWEQIGDGTEWHSLLDQVRARIEVAPESLEDDVTEFVRQLHERGLIELQ